MKVAETELREPRDLRLVSCMNQCGPMSSETDVMTDSSRPDGFPGAGLRRTAAMVARACTGFDSVQVQQSLASTS